MPQIMKAMTPTLNFRNMFIINNNLVLSNECELTISVSVVWLVLLLGLGLEASTRYNHRSKHGSQKKGACIYT